MERTWLLCVLWLGLSGCDTARLALVPLPVDTGLVPGPLPDSALTVGIGLVPVPPRDPGLDGRWVIADEFGDQFCITVQQRRISILNEGCLTNGLGFAARLNKAPPAAIAGRRLILTTTYEPTLFDDTEVELTFTGDRQLDGSYVGRLATRETTIEVVGGEEFVVETISERSAVLTRD